MNLFERREFELRMLSKRFPFEKQYLVGRFSDLVIPIQSSVQEICLVSLWKLELPRGNLCSLFINGFSSVFHTFINLNITHLTRLYGAQAKDCWTICYRHHLIYLVSSNSSIMIDHLWTNKKENKVLNICTCSLDMSSAGKYTTFLFLSSEYEFQFTFFTISL